MDISLGIVEGSYKYYCISYNPLSVSLRKLLASSHLNLTVGSSNFNIFLKVDGAIEI